MTDLPRRIAIAELAPREGFQIEAASIPTARKIALIDALADTGIREIETASFVNPQRVPGMADAEAVVAGITPRTGVAYTAVWFNQRGLQRAQETGRIALRGVVRLYSSAEFLQRNLNQAPAEQIAYAHRELELDKRHGIPVERAIVTTAFGCNFEGEIAPERIVALFGQAIAIAEEHGIRIPTLSVVDTMAWGTPGSIQRLVGMLRDRFPDHAVHLHLHDTRGMGIANAAAGLQMGVDAFDASVGGLGGCPFAAHEGAAGNLCTEDFVFMCHEMGIETGIDLERIIECARMAEAIVGHPLPGAVMRGGSLDRLRRRA